MIETICVLALLVGLVYFAVHEIRDLIFYYRCGFDFTVENPGRLKIYPGNESGVTGEEVSNFHRVVFAQPFIIFVCALIALTMVFAG